MFLNNHLLITTDGKNPNSEHETATNSPTLTDYFSVIGNKSLFSDLPPWINSTDVVRVLTCDICGVDCGKTFVKWRLLPPPQSENTTWATLSRDQCLKYKGTLVGEACGYVPDITLMSFILFFGTYACSMALKQFKTSRFFPTTVRGGPLAEGGRGGCGGVVLNCHRRKRGLKKPQTPPYSAGEEAHQRLCHHLDHSRLLWRGRLRRCEHSEAHCAK